ncbi:tyrosine-protein phosphatase Lar isoform X2 [Daktulosphaira vitifoliae]|uniref:tyrosine-protein phosphatase Lar isoform X2 n=1 Tax=Daktulosphaira vitifoliae TaxID=58002 RepID=UPI0021AA4143|nr:tyrosine-protein phosphatase Lar isoform X2 [Daktulosphaira vitifoliae]
MYKQFIIRRTMYSWQTLITIVLAYSAVCAFASGANFSSFIQYLTQPPTLTVKPRSQQAKNNAVASFYCGAKGDPRPTIQWRKNNKKISESNRYIVVDRIVGDSETGSVLRIEPTRSHRDNAVYECFAENGVGDAVSANAKLEVFDEKDLPQGFPVITEGPGTHKTIEVGHNAVLQCSASGNPSPAIYWLKENMRLDLETNPRYSILDKGFPGALQISDSQETDQGKYECVAENAVGTQHAPAVALWVRVRRVPPQFSIPPPTLEKVKVGENVSIPCVAVGSPMPYVKWRRGKTTELSPEDKLPVGRNVLNLTNVEQSDNYTCIAASSLGMIEATTFIKVLTLPSPPIDVKVSDVTSTSIRLSWSHPNPDDIQYYTISHKPKSAAQSPGVISGVVTMYYTIRPLSPYTQYEFTVSAVNGFGHGPPSQPIVATTGETEPGSAPRNIQVRMLSSSTMVVQWEEPETPNGQVVRYKVYYTKNPNEQLSSWNTMVVDNNQLTTISDLAAHSIYTIRVQAFTNVGPGPLSPPVQFKTQQGVPSQPRDLRIGEIGETSIVLQWSKPNHNAEQMSGYELHWNDTYAKETHSQHVPVTESYTLNGLYPNTLYYVWLAAKSLRGEGAPTPPLQVRTKQYVPGAPPQNITAEAISPTSILVQWQPPPSDRSNGHIVYYKVMATENGMSDSDANQYRVENVTSYTLDDLKRWTEYRIWVLAGTSVGDGPSSYPITVRTREDVPGPPTDVKVQQVNSTTIHVQWRPPSEEQRNGIIRGYHIHVQEAKPEGNALLNEPLRFDVAEALESNVTNLQPDTLYAIQVAAITRKGDGDRSHPVKIKTPGGVPVRPVVSLKILEREPKVNIELEWTRPTNTYGELLGYKLRYGIRGQEMFDIMLTENKRRINDLERGVQYEFHISGQNQVGFGQEATEYLSTPEGPPTGPPTNVSYQFQTPDVVCIVWNQPSREHRNGQIVRYDVQFHKKIDQSTITHRNTTLNKAVFSGLEEATEYVVTVRAVTVEGDGPWSPRMTINTTREMVRAPMGLKAVATSDQSIQVWWEAVPARVKLTGYRIYYTMTAVEDLNLWNTKDVPVTDSTDLANLEKMAQYAIAVVAKTDDGFGRLSEKVTVIVKPDEVPLNLRASDLSTHSMTLSWTPPIKLNPIGYKISFNAIKEFRDSQGMTQLQLVPTRVIELDKYVLSHTIDDLSPFISYSVNVSAIPSDKSYRPPSRITVTTQMAAPQPMVKPDFYGVLNGEKIQVILPQASEEYGPICHYYLIVVPENPDTISMNPDEFLTHKLVENSQQELLAEGEPYITAKFPHRSLPWTFYLGNGETYDGFVNRKLDHNTKYKIFVRAFVDTPQKHLYTSSPFSEPLSLEMREVGPGDTPKKPGLSDINMPGNNIPGIGNDHVSVRSSAASSPELLWLVGPVIAAILLTAALVLLFVVKKRRRPNKYGETSGVTKPLIGNSHPNNDPVELRRLQFQTPAMVSHPPVSINYLAQHIDLLKANDNFKFSQEYESIEPGQQFTWDHSNMEVNKPKNRYANVIAYDHSRVVLHPIDGIVGSDYINANYCDGYRKHNAYIATQGPLQDTFSDFWRMCWEVKTSTIVMMTKLEERTRVKCDQYWPSRGSQVYGPITVTLVNVQELSTYVIRSFHLTRATDNETREVKQLQFGAWPDHGVPDHPAPLLQFMKRVRAVNLMDSGPVVVHCSAGVGRTGCFIVIDAMLERAKHEHTVDIYAHVTCLRAQRNYMVQTEEQYIFIHDALLEAVTCGETEIAVRNLPMHIQQLSQMDPATTVTGMELEFKKLALVKSEFCRFVSASLPVNKPKNRLVHLLPFESTRVCLSGGSSRGLEGSDYINANFIDGYRQRSAYIATQGPLQNTTDDFWRMLWEHNSTIVVMLTKLHEMGREKCYQYWPSERSVRYDTFVVEPITEYNMPQYILREFKVTDTIDNASRTVRQFQFTDWPEQGVPKSAEGFIDFIGQVHKTKEQFGQEGPITVHCSGGVGRTGVFISLSIVLERMQCEGAIDLFQTIRILRTQRPAMVQTEEQYQFCYQAALEYLGSFDQYSD